MTLLANLLCFSSNGVVFRATLLQPKHSKTAAGLSGFGDESVLSCSDVGIPCAWTARTVESIGHKVIVVFAMDDWLACTSSLPSLEAAGVELVNTIGFTHRIFL